jgi:hypothetical protein
VLLVGPNEIEGPEILALPAWQILSNQDSKALGKATGQTDRVVPLSETNFYAVPDSITSD